MIASRKKSGPITMLATLLALAWLGSGFASPEEASRLPGPTRTLVDTGFEGGTTGSPSTAIENLRVDRPGGAASFPIEYEAGTPADRYARIVTDPVDPSNHVLLFWIKNAVVPAYSGDLKARIALSVKEPVADFVETRRMYLDPDMALYKTYPGANSWFTIQDFFVGKPWQNDPNAFKIMVNIGKKQGVGEQLHLIVIAQKFNAGASDPRTQRRSGGQRSRGSMRRQSGGGKRWLPAWSRAAEEYNVPVGEWIDVRTTYIQGDRNSGLFSLEVKENGAYRTIIEAKDWTYNPNGGPANLSAFAPLKIYTSDKIIDHIRKQGGAAQIYWDDLKIVVPAN